MARQQLGLQDFVGIVDVVNHLDAGLRLELLQHLVRDVVTPVVDMQYRLLGCSDIGAKHTGCQQTYQGKP